MRFGLDPIHAGFVAAELPVFARATKRARHLGRHRTGMTGPGDHRTPLLEVRFPTEAGGVLRSKPAGIAVELVVPERMPRDVIDVVPLREQAKHHVTGGDPATDHHHSLVGLGPSVESRIKHVLDAPISNGCPVRPAGLFTAPDRKYELTDAHHADNIKVLPLDPPVTPIERSRGGGTVHVLDEDGLLNSNLNECFLYHGTKREIADIIVAHGFDERLAQLKGLYGAGNYFAENASKVRAR